jgi:hypothetical protein
MITLASAYGIAFNIEIGQQKAGNKIRSYFTDDKYVGKQIWHA